MPKGPKGDSMPLTAPDGWYLNANTKNAAQAMNFALYMTSPVIEQLFVDQAGHIPANKTIKVTDPVVLGFGQQMLTGFARPQNKEFDNFWTPFGDALTKVLEKGEASATALGDACSAMDKANNK